LHAGARCHGDACNSGAFSSVRQFALSTCIHSRPWKCAWCMTTSAPISVRSHRYWVAWKLRASGPLSIASTCVDMCSVESSCAQESPTGLRPERDGPSCLFLGLTCESLQIFCQQFVRNRRVLRVPLISISL
jgi:hypothetical protein